LIDKKSAVIAKRGSIDMRGYEIVRVQFFNSVVARSVTFSGRGVKFSAECIRNLDDTEFVEILIHPSKNTLVVRACSKENKLAMRWASFNNGMGYARRISGAAYIRILYELFGWVTENKYKFRGSVRIVDGHKAIEFDLSEPEIIISKETQYREDWQSGFGKEYYLNVHANVISGYADNSSKEIIYNNEPDIHPTQPNDLSAGIAKLINDMKRPEMNNGIDEKIDS